ncbi:unnamed protein product [Paramecium primaurelia]|uniref:Transmembrane protein n=1 Tax=Paramecium primaurelia TaxID=5886 RepID=A0A8S1QIB4_PARPR|nr:unnamed protein product [Paramecium primaurelia]
MLLLFIFIVPLLSQTCFSNKAAVDCTYLKCCSQQGYCAVNESECYYSAEKYSCDYAECDYCCIYNGDTVECGTQNQCLAWIFILLGSWLLMTLIVIFAAINRKRNVATRMIVIAEKAKLVALDNSRKSIVSQIIGTEEQQYGKEFQVNIDNYNLQL